MADLNLTQAEADVLIAMEKHRVNEDRHDFPMSGESLLLSLQSPDKREQFLLDISRGRIDLLRGKIPESRTSSGRPGAVGFRR